MAFFDSLLSGDYTGAILQGAATLGSAAIAAGANSDAAQTASDAKTAAAGITADSATKAAQIQADASLKGAQIQADANKDALGQYINFAGQGRDQLNASKVAGLAAIDTGTGQYASTIAPLLTPNPIVLPAYRGLTAQQQTGESDMLRNAGATLAASGLRGAGRAGVAAVLDQDRRYQEDARSSNDTDTRNEERRAQGVANNAISGLAGVQASAGGAKANTEVGVGNQLANNFSQLGSTAANLTSAAGNALGAGTTAAGAATAGGVSAAGGAQAGAVDANGQTTASSDLANAKLTGSTLGSLGSIIAGQISPGPIGSNSNVNLGSTFSGAGGSFTGKDDPTYGFGGSGV